MKAMVDSRELAEKMKVALYFTSKRVGAEFTTAALLTVTGSWLNIRTSNGEQHSLQAVNAFETEDGMAVVNAAALSASAFDTGSMMEISLGKKLYLTSGAYKARLSLLQTNPDDFPVMFETDEVIRLPDRLLKTVVAHTEPASPTPLKASIFLVPDDDIVYLIGTDGTIGFMSKILGTLDQVISIGSSSILSAIAGLTGMIRIGVAHNGSVISVAGDGPSRVNFTRTSANWTDKILNFFTLDAGRSFFMSNDDAERLKRMCVAALGAEDNSMLILHTAGDKTIAEVHGGTVRFEDELDVGAVPVTPFSCKMMNRAIGSLMPADEYEVEILDNVGKMPFWRWKYDSHIHFAGTATAEFIKGRLDELGFV